MCCDMEQSCANLAICFRNGFLSMRVIVDTLSLFDMSCDRHLIIKDFFGDLFEKVKFNVRFNCLWKVWSISSTQCLEKFQTFFFPP